MSDQQPSKDMVCGTEVDPLTTIESSDYNGTTYHFCSASCKQHFDHAPQLYVPGPVINPVTGISE